MKHKIPKGCLIAVGLLLVFIFGILTLLCWMFSDHEFRYGSLNYWIFTDSEIRELPLIGTKKADVLYTMEASDGPKPPIFLIKYTSQNNPQKIIDTYKAHYNKLGYAFTPSYQLRDDYLEYQGKRNYDEIGIYVYNDQESGSSAVRISYIIKI